MWFELEFGRFQVKQAGFECVAMPQGAFYRSPGLTTVTSVGDLNGAEYGQAIELNRSNRSLSFGRDYLGHFPLLYALTDQALFIADELSEVRQWLLTKGITPTLSEEAVALYFSMGYVPQGITLFEQIKTCRNATLYHFKRNKLLTESIFKLIAVDPQCSRADLRESLEAEFDRLSGLSSNLDVWCSGGLDSSIVASRLNTSGRQANRLTLSYDDAVVQHFGDGELRFAKQMAQHCQASLTEITLTQQRYADAYQTFVRQHISPVVDIVVPPKYALAEATRELAVTGEGADPMISGVKNNLVLFMRDRLPDVPVGVVYALAHKRLFAHVETLMKRGPELKAYVTEYLQSAFDAYPGDLTRKLFYLNTFEKQGGMIFPKNYYAVKRYGVKVRHPMASLNVYQTVFRLADDKKYRYPKGKLALSHAYSKDLPASIVNRKKSGTRLPLEWYLRYIREDQTNFAHLLDSNFFIEASLSGGRGLATAVNDDCRDSLRRYGLITLNAWLSYATPNNQRGSNHETRTVSVDTCYQQQSTAIGSL